MLLEAIGSWRELALLSRSWLSWLSWLSLTRVEWTLRRLLKRHGAKRKRRNRS